MEIKIKDTEFKCNEILMIKANTYSDGELIRKWYKQIENHMGKLDLECVEGLERLNFEEKEIEIEHELYQSISSLHKK